TLPSAVYTGSQTGCDGIATGTVMASGAALWADTNFGPKNYIAVSPATITNINIPSAGGVVNALYMGTANTTTSSGNYFFCVNASTGQIIWHRQGGPCGDLTDPDNNTRLSLDIVSGKPVVDTLHGIVYFTSHAHGTVTQPSVWALDATD